MNAIPIDGLKKMMKTEQFPYIQIILDSIADGLFTVDCDFHITSFNRAAEKITGISVKKAIGSPCRKVFKAEICEKNCMLLHSIRTGEPVINCEISITDAKGMQVPVSISTAIIKDDDGKVVGGVETFRDLTAEKAIRAELTRQYTVRNIVTKNTKMHSLLRLLETVAETEATVLLEGESGTGKGLFAEAIHGQSARRKNKMITVDCGSLPQSLLESELFGYKAGAFTDAKKDKPGRIALAEGGTLFLDEIGNMPLALQSKLLRVIQDRIYEPLGSVRPEAANLRIIAATNQSLENLVTSGNFRTDLYYRIKVMRMVLPTLQERREDIPLLAEHFIKKFSVINSRNIVGIEPDAILRLMEHDWPGNVRELENVIEYATVVCKTNRITAEDLPEDLKPERETRIRLEAVENHSPENRLLELEKIYICDLFKKHQYNRKAVASDLGIHPSTLWRKIKRLGIAFPNSDGRSCRRKKNPDFN
jgi:PAS domain S-box-containing protein